MFMDEYEHPSMSFADRLHILQKSKGVSIREISKATGIGATTLRHYETGTQPGFDNVIKLAEYFGVSLDYLAYGYMTHSYTGNPAYSFKERVRELLEEEGTFSIESDDYISSKVYLPSYCNSKHTFMNMNEALVKSKERSKKHFSNYGNVQLKEDMLAETLTALLKDRSVLEEIALYLYSTDRNVMISELLEGAPKDILLTSEEHHLGVLRVKLDIFKHDYYIERSVSKKNKNLMFLED